MGKQIKGEFIGFSIGDFHSSDLGIIRTSDGSRYNTNLLPTIQDKTIQLPGRDGMYYFNSDFTSKQINIQIAFDSLTEKQLKFLKQILGNKNLQKLTFDEEPEVYYWVKSTGTPNLKWICFDDLQIEGSNSVDLFSTIDFQSEKKQGVKLDDFFSIHDRNNRVYKGEGTLSFINYYGVGFQDIKINSQFNPEVNRIERIIQNSGDKNTDFKIQFELNITNTTEDAIISCVNSLQDQSEAGFEIKLPKPLLQELNGKKIIIDTKTNSFGYMDNTGQIQIMNQFFKGSFFKLGVGRNYMELQSNIPIRELWIDYQNQFF